MQSFGSATTSANLLKHIGRFSFGYIHYFTMQYPHLSLQQITYTDIKPFKAYWEVPVWVYSLIYYVELWSLPASLSHMLQQITYTDRKPFKAYWEVPVWVYSLLYYAELWSLPDSIFEPYATTDNIH